MDKVVDLKRVLEKTKAETQTEDSQVKNVAQPSNVKKSTNPILKKLVQFKNDNLSNKFDINDLLR